MEADVRAELERIASVGRDDLRRVEAERRELADVQAERVAAAIQENRRQAEIGRKRDEEAEAARVAAGERPSRMGHEDRDGWHERLMAWYQTPAGVAYEAEEKRQQRERQDRENFAKLDVRVRDGGIPQRIADIVKAGDLMGTDPLVEVKRGGFLALTLAGDPGTGKSIAAAWWLMQPYLPGGPGTGRLLWVSSARLARWQRYDDSDMRKILEADRLVLDDIGTEYADQNGSFLATFDEVVNDRMENNRPTVITTNLAAPEFRERYKARIADRLGKVGRFVAFAGPSLRRG